MDPSNQNPPRFTATALGCLERNGKKYYRGATAASSVNAAEAENAARALAQSRAEIAAGSGFFQKARASYPYPERILNEPLIDRVSLAGAATDAVAREIAKITRNSHGSTVLNAYEVMFVDVDTVQDLDNAAEGSVVEETAALAELHGLCSRQEELCFRVYATKAGLRYLCTSRLFDPVSAESQNILSSLRADKRYAALCRVQKCYRARLSPKLRRCVVARPKPAGLFARLLSAGPKKKIDPSAFATCRYLETVGQTKTNIPDIEMIVELHDELTESVSAKPLA